MKKDQILGGGNEEKLKASENDSNTSHSQLSKLLSEGIPGIDENVTGTH